MSGSGRGSGLLAGHVVLVTGADGTGVGRGIADAVVEAGGQLVVHGRTAASAAAAAQRWRGSAIVHGDVRDEADVDRFVADAAAVTGTVDGLVNNAGVGLNTPFFEATAEQFDQLYGVDVRGAWLTTRAVVRGWRRTRQPRGAVVHVSSVHAMATMNGYALYAGAKAAINGLTRGMAVEIGASGYRCNAIAPGYVDSEQNIDLLRGLTADPAAWVDQHVTDQQVIPAVVDGRDCGRWAAFLLSPAATGVTGQVIPVDNGTTALLYNRAFTDIRGTA